MWHCLWPSAVMLCPIVPSSATNPMITRIIRTLTDGADKALTAINAARAAARARICALSGAQAPNHGSDARSPMIIDIGATLVIAHSEKGQARPVQEEIRVSPLTGVHRPQKARLRRTRRRAATARQCRIEHRRRSHRTGQGCSRRSSKRESASGQEGTHPH
jgi:hypothetical protein